MGVQLSAQGSIIKTAYEAEANTNAYTDAEVTKLAGIVPGVATTNVFEIPGSLARGDIFFIDASGNLVRLPAGSNGHFLKTQSTTGDPVWAALPGGGDMLQATYDPNADGIIAIAQGGSGQATAQAAIDALTQVAGATNEHVLTKDTTTGNATWKVGGGGGVTDHSLLSNLAYATAGHTGFAANPAVANLDMENNNIIDVSNVQAKGDKTAVLNLQGADLITYPGGGAMIGVYGTLMSGADIYKGAIGFYAPNSGATDLNMAMRVDGITDTPFVYIYYGLDMNSKKIENLLAGSAAADAIRKDQAMLLDGTQAMAADVDLGGNDILKCFRIYANGTASQLDLYGGTSTGGGGGIACFGKTHATTAYRGDVRFYNPNAAGNSYLLSMVIDGLTDTPKVGIYYGLDMNSKKIESLLAGTVSSDAIRKDQAMLLDGTQAMGADLNMFDGASSKIIGLAAGTIASDAIRKDQAMLLDGTQAMGADLNMNSKNIDNINDIAVSGMSLFDGGQRHAKTDAGAADYNPSTITSDYIITVDTTAAARAVTISTEDRDSGTAANPRIFIIKDLAGNAATNNITVSLETAGTIDGAATFVLNGDYNSITLLIDGTNGYVI